MIATTDSIVLIGMIVGLLVALGIGAFLMLKGKGKIPMFLEKWSFDAWSKNVKLSYPAGSVLAFTFGEPHTLQKDIGKPIGQFGQLSATFEITGNNPVWIAGDEGNATPIVAMKLPGAQLYSDDDWQAELALGRCTLSVPLKPANWKTIDGVPCNHDQAHINLFNKAIERSHIVALCFGGRQSGEAHGVNLKSGTATFRLISFSP